MKSKLYHFFIALGITLGLVSMSNVASAYYSRGYCKMVPAHWSHGRYIPAHKVCYNRGYRGYGQLRCKMVPSYWRHGVHYPAHRVCWRR